MFQFWVHRNRLMKWMKLHDLHAFACSKPVNNQTGNASLGKRRGKSVVDIFKRPFSRKSMTPPASPGSQSKQAKGEEAIRAVESDPAAVVSAEAPAAVVPEESADSTPLPPTPPTPPPPNPPAEQQTLAENGTEVNAPPLPPTPTFTHSTTVGIPHADAHASCLIVKNLF